MNVTTLTARCVCCVCMHVRMVLREIGSVVGYMIRWQLHAFWRSGHKGSIHACSSMVDAAVNCKYRLCICLPAPATYVFHGRARPILWDLASRGCCTPHMHIITQTPPPQHTDTHQVHTQHQIYMVTTLNNTVPCRSYRYLAASAPLHRRSTHRSMPASTGQIFHSAYTYPAPKTFGKP